MGLTRSAIQQQTQSEDVFVGSIVTPDISPCSEALESVLHSVAPSTRMETFELYSYSFSLYARMYRNKKRADVYL